MSRVMSTPTTPTQPSTARTPTTTPTFTVPQDQIAARAYERWCKRGRPCGTHLTDWYEAEAEIKKEMMAGTMPRR